MKQSIKFLLASAMLINSSSIFANESQHWVCESEALYRSLLSANLYGVGKPPESGCQKLPTGVPIEQLACETTDFELCQYRWEGMEKSSSFWGSPIIMPPKTQINN